MTEWNITGMRKCAQPRVYSSASQSGTPSAAAATLTHFSLDTVAAYDVDMDVGDRKNPARITLHRVPSFLVEAFAVLDTNKAWTTEGVFRKEGNSTRMRNAHRIYCGLTSIPKECTTHDVCSLIKRFFRELKPSIFMDKQRNILKFAETLRDRALLQSILTLFDTLPPSHKATLAFLMRQLHKASESSAANQMTIDNLAVVFAPTLFRDDPVPPTPASRKKRGSQDSLLNTILTQNELRASVVKLFITNAHLLGVPSAAEQPTRHVVRKPSDLKRKQVAPTGFNPADKKVSPRSASESAPRRPAAEQSASSAKEPLAPTKSSDSKYAAKRHAKKDKDFQKNRKRSSSVARIFSVISNLYSKPSGGGESRPTTPAPHSSKDRPEAPQMDFHDDDANREQSGPSHAFLKTPERLSRVHSPRRANVNATPSDARCKRVPTARTPITTVFGVEDNGGTRPQRTMSMKVPARPVHTDTPRKPSDAQKSQLPVPAPADNAYSLGEEYIKKGSTSRLRAVALQIDRPRRHTAPVKQSGIKRNQPNTLNSGLTEPRARRCNTMVVYNNNDENQPTRRRRRTQSIDSSNEESPSHEELEASDADEVFFSLSSANDSANTTQDILELKGIEARRRRAKYRCRKNTGTDGGLLVSSPEADASATPRQALAVKNTNIPASASPPPLPSCPPPADDSLDSIPGRPSVYYTPQSSRKGRSSPQFLNDAERSAPQSARMSSALKDDDLTPIAGTTYDDQHAAAALQSPKTREEWMPHGTTPPPRPSAAPQQHSPKATKFPNGPTTPKRPLGPVTSSPLPGDKGSPSGFAASSERLREIVSAKTSKELEEKSQLPPCARPSIALFQRQNRGFVQQRVHQFASLFEAGPLDQSTRSSMAAFGIYNTDASDAAAAKPSGAAPRSVQSRLATTSSFKRSTGTSALHGRSPAARTGIPLAAAASSTSSSRNALASSTSAGVLPPRREPSPPRREPSPPRSNFVMFGRRNAISAVDIRRRQRTSASESDRH